MADCNTLPSARCLFPCRMFVRGATRGHVTPSKQHVPPILLVSGCSALLQVREATKITLISQPGPTC